MTKKRTTSISRFSKRSAPPSTAPWSPFSSLPLSEHQMLRRLLRRFQHLADVKPGEAHALLAEWSQALRMHGF